MSDRLRILVVEDNPELGALYLNVLGAAGYGVVVARDAAQAVREMGEAPDLIILDLLIPGADGITLLERIRRDEIVGTTPVIVVSAALPPGQERIEGANALMRKPFDFDDLLQTIEDVMSSGRRVEGALTV